MQEGTRGRERERARGRGGEREREQERGPPSEGGREGGREREGAGVEDLRRALQTPGPIVSLGT
jgi:hypothetical protein